MATYTQIMDSSEVEARARPILAEVAAQIADVQVRNRGTIGGNICSNDPTNHLPPLLVALGASMTIRGAAGERTVPADEFFLGVYMTVVGEGELLTLGVRPAAATRRTASRRSRSAATAPASRTPPRASQEGQPRIALGCVDAVPGPADAERDDEESIGRPSPTRRSTRRPTSTRPADYRRHLAEVLRRARGRPSSRERAVSGEEPSTSRIISVEVNGDVYEREVEARRLLVHFIRDDLDLTGTHIGCDTGNCGACTVHLDGQLVKSCMLLAVQADGAKIGTVEGLANGRRASRSSSRSPTTTRSSAATAHRGC